MQALGTKMKGFPGQPPERAAVEVKPAFPQPVAEKQAVPQPPEFPEDMEQDGKEERDMPQDIPPCVQQPDIFEQPAVAASGRAAEEPFFDVLSKIEEAQAMPVEADPVPSLSRPAEELADAPSASGRMAAPVQEAWPAARVRPAGQRVPGQRPAAYRPVHARKKRTFLDTLADLLR